MDQTVKDCVRCNGRTKNGTVCKRRTCIYSTYCWQHAVSQVGVKIKTSTIPGAGKGLFAARDLPRGTQILYEGERMTRAQIDHRYPGDMLGAYVLCDPDNVNCVDARSTQSSMGRWANDPRGTRKRANAKFKYENGVFALELTKLVKKDDEILISYGPEYWGERRQRAKRGRS